MAVQDTLNTDIDLARRLTEQSRTEEALEIYERIAEAAPQRWDVRATHVQLLYGLGRLDAAQELIARYVRGVDQIPPAALNDLGVIHFVNDSRERAISCFIKALRATTPPDNAVPLANLAYALYDGGRFDECAEMCLTSTRLEPDERRPHYILAAIDAARAKGRTYGALPSGARVQAFRWLRLCGAPPAPQRTVVMGDDQNHLQIVESTPAGCAGTPWGILATYRDEAWCGFATQDSGGLSAVVPLPRCYYLVQRRKWVRLPATGAVSRLEIRAFPDGTEPFDLIKVHELNLSVEGAAVRTEPELPTGTILSIFLDLADTDEPLEVQARVIRMCRPETGGTYSAMFFHELDEKTRERIACALHQLQLSKKRKSRAIEVQL